MLQMNSNGGEGRETNDESKDPKRKGCSTEGALYGFIVGTFVVLASGLLMMRMRNSPPFSFKSAS